MLSLRNTRADFPQPMDRATPLRYISGQLNLREGASSMKTLNGLFAAAAMVASVSLASAADMRPAYKAAPVAAPMYNWSGFYSGIHAGYAWGDANASVAGLASSGDVDGFFGGGQIGWNWQASGSPWVWGFEADIAFSNIGDSSTAAGVTVESDVELFGTVRGRLGYAVDRALWYITGGLAWANNEISVVAPGINVSSSNTHIGWTIGGGLEWAIADAWTAKIEYLYMDFGSENYFTSILGTPLSVDADIHTVKIGLNYRWGWVGKGPVAGKGPVVAKY